MDSTLDESTPSAGNITYAAERVIGHGSFGVVFLAKVVETGDVVAIKKVLQDKRFRNRELQILRGLQHRNIIRMKHCFYSNGEKPDELYLNVVMEYLPDTCFRFCRMFTRQKEHVPVFYVKLFTYQLFRALAYLHNPKLNMCHRDIKPQNMLIDPATGVMKLCDFGSAKQLQSGQQNIAYICSRYYRAPELILGSTTYTTAVDLWSAGAVLAEMLLGQPLFPGETTVDQMVEIIKVVGTPSVKELESLKKDYAEFKFPSIQALPWSRVFHSFAPPEAVDLVSKLLRYNPSTRLSAIDAMAHPFYDELRGERLMPNSKPLPPLFDFSEVERAYIPAAVIARLLPTRKPQ